MSANPVRSIREDNFESEVTHATVPVLLDFTQVPHVSQDGLRTMLAIYRQAQATNGKVCVVGIAGQLHLALSATGFLRFFLVAEDVEEGIDVLQAATTDSSKIEESVAS